MSRGLGKRQHALVDFILARGKPTTFADIRAMILEANDGWIPSSYERSLRRALHRLVETEILIPIGGGGRGDPLRYFYHPIGIAFMEGKERRAALFAALEADPGGAEAADKSIRPKPKHSA
jgi:hypothetical protein